MGRGGEEGMGGGRVRVGYGRGGMGWGGVR